MADGILSKGIEIFAKNLYNGSSPSNEYKYLSGLYEIPDLTSSTERVEITTLDDSVRKYIKGIKDYDNLSFNFIMNDDGILSGCNTNFECLNKTAQHNSLVEFKLYIPEPTNDDTYTCATFKATIDAGIAGVGINERVEFKVDMTLQSDIAFTFGQNLPTTVETPTITVPTGTLPKTVTITCATADASIYYTTDGSAPTEQSSLYESGIYVSAACTIKAKAFKAGMNPSAIQTQAVS